jgi:hypothetical protein
MSKIIIVKDLFTLHTLPTFYVFYIINNSYDFLKESDLDPICKDKLHWTVLIRKRLMMAD